ncbi:MAG: methylated-DNA--[protein]-cysteine S-methyltransferase [Spirochaetales bacterium]
MQEKLHTKTALYAYRFGYIRIDYRDDIVTCLQSVHSSSITGENTAFSDRVFQEIGEYLAGKRKLFDFFYESSGTEFQKKVWNALCDIPYGETRTYKDIAVAIGNPKACRAVGSANNKNSLHIVVPCHRVVGSGGNLVGYACGLEMKKALLSLEKTYKNQLG